MKLEKVAIDLGLPSMLLVGTAIGVLDEWEGFANYKNQAVLAGAKAQLHAAHTAIGEAMRLMKQATE